MHNVPNIFIVLGDKSNGSATESRDLPTNSAILYHNKKKLSASRRSYEKQHPENRHLYVKPFHSDPTNASSCGHLALAKKLSREYKCHNPVPNSSVTGKDQSSTEHSEDRTNLPDSDDAYKPDKIHQQLRRQLAIQGNNDPRAATLGKTYNVNYSVKHGYRDPVSASNELTVDSSTTARNVSSCSISEDTATQLDTSGSGPCTNHVKIKPELPQASLSNDPQQLVTARSQDHQSGVRFPSPLLASTTTSVDSVYIVRPVVFPYDYVRDLHSRRPFPAPRLVPSIHLSPSWPQMFVYQSRSFLPHNKQVGSSVISAHRFLHR